VEDGAEAGPLPDIEWRPYRRSRDWRVYAAGLGRVLVSTGILVLAFVAYQLWGTGIQAAQAQNELEDEFEAALAASSTTTAATTTSAESTTTEPDATTTTTTVAPPTLPPVQEGDAIAQLQIPSIGVDWYVVAGVRVEDLQKGPGHYPDTPRPGQEGNVAIAGHRTTYGAPFSRIDELQPGEEIALTTVTGRFVYRVTGQKVVPPTDASVLDPTPTPSLTLTSCHPKYSARERIIVTAEFDAGAAQGSLLPAATGSYAGGVPAPPPTLAPATSSTTATTEAAAESTTEAAAAPDTTAPVPAPDETASAAALEHGWFDDPDAWPQVALWGTVLTAISIGAWLLSRWAGSNWVGGLVGIVPFVVVLYFFFENVNRLLPPNL
jgi:sortase A